MFRFALTVTTCASLALGTMAVSPGALAVWGLPTDPLVLLGPPDGAFLALAAGGNQQTLAIRSDRTLYLSPAAGLIPEIPSDLADQEFCGVGMGRGHGLAIRHDGRIEAWPEAARAGMPLGSRFVAVTGAGGLFSVALDIDGNLVLWGGGDLASVDYDKLVAVGPPPGITFKAIAARGRFTLALSADGHIYGWGTGATSGVDFEVFTSSTGPWLLLPSGHHYIAPAESGNPYTAIAAGLSLVVALRADGSVVQWSTGLMGPLDDPPAGIVFTRIAAGNNFAVGIDQSGQLHAWGNPAQTTITGAVPVGTYVDVSTAVTHVTAIAAPDVASPDVTITGVEPAALWPPNHRMENVAVTFRADDGCAPIAPSALSVSLRSNQPDNGFGSGNTTGDTNGKDGYTSDVVIPSTAIVRNGDGSFTATFQLRAETSNAWAGVRTYTVSVTASDDATPSNTTAPVKAHIVVAR
jgi:hypothetical protein